MRCASATSTRSGSDGNRIQRTGPLVGGLIAQAGETPDGWFDRGYNVSGDANNLTAFAICVSP
jgi:hypothetical protein